MNSVATIADRMVRVAVESIEPVFLLTPLGGTQINIGSETFAGFGDDPESVRAAIDAIEFLEQRGFIYSESPTSDVFRLTREGWIYGRRLIDPEYEPPTKSNDGLSVEAEELLKEAVSTGLDICWAQYIGPVNEHIEVGSKVISTPGDDESTAFYVGGINDLVANGYARREDPSGRRFVLTSAGWQLGRRLSGIQ